MRPLFGGGAPSAKGAKGRPSELSFSASLVDQPFATKVADGRHEFDARLKRAEKLDEILFFLLGEFGAKDHVEVFHGIVQGKQAPVMR